MCGEFCVKKGRKQITELFENIYQRYFGLQMVCGEGVDFAPNVVCEKCYRGLLRWNRGEIECIEYAFPMMWAARETHVATDCYFCSVDIDGHNRKTKSIINYPNVDSALRPVLRRPGMPMPIRHPPMTPEQFSPLHRNSQPLDNSPINTNVPSTSSATDPTFVPAGPPLCEHAVFTKQQYVIS